MTQPLPRELPVKFRANRSFHQLSFDGRCNAGLSYSALLTSLMRGLVASVRLR